jgi:CheY-like chemotaxis protein/tetratricopeptide (TPR) repeat protein
LVEAIHSCEQLRVVLVDGDAAAGARLVAELRARGFRVTACTNAHGALRTLYESGADAVLLATPLGDSDWIAAAAALKEGTSPPALIVLDGTGQGAELGRVLPADRAPDAILPRSASTAELLFWMAEVLGSLGAAGPCFPEILVALRARGDSGVLEVRGGGVCTRILLRAGVPVFAEGGALRETLGRMLLRRGALTEAEYVRVIERMTERLIENEATRMGEVLVELGLLTPQDVFDALSVQVLEKVISCFRVPHFEHHFEPLDALPEDVLAYGCPPVEALVLAGIREHFDAARIEPLFAAHAATRARLLRGVEETALRFHVTSAEQRLLRELGDERTLAELRDQSALGAAHAAQVLAALLVTRALVLVDEPAAGRAAAPPTTNPRVATAAHSVPRSEPAHAAVRRAAEPKPETVRPRVVAVNSLSKLRRELVRSGKAPTPEPPRPADERSARIEAERAFRQGIQMLEQSALGGAQKAFALACERNADEPEYQLFAAWTQVLSVKDEEARGVARTHATAWARRVLERDRDSVRAQTILGQLAAAAGDIDVAERHFRHALRVAPADRDALRGMRVVERRRSEQPAASKPEKAKKR